MGREGRNGWEGNVVAVEAVVIDARKPNMEARYQSKWLSYKILCVPVFNIEVMVDAVLNPWSILSTRKLLAPFPDRRQNSH